MRYLVCTYLGGRTLRAAVHTAEDAGVAYELIRFTLQQSWALRRKDLAWHVETVV